MGSHDIVHGADELAADEDDGDGRRVSEEPHQSALNLLASWVVVQLVDHGVDAHSAEEALDGMAHAAGAEAEDHHRILRSQPRYPLQRIRHRSRGRVEPPGLRLLVVHLNNNTLMRRAASGRTERNGMEYGNGEWRMEVRGKREGAGL